eukprot:255952-Amorphochlora_amoeboformis.AAC.1
MGVSSPGVELSIFVPRIGYYAHVSIFIRTSTSPVTKQQLLSSSIRSRVLAPKFISKFPRVHLESKNFYTNGRHDSKRCLAYA